MQICFFWQVSWLISKTLDDVDNVAGFGKEAVPEQGGQGEYRNPLSKSAQSILMKMSMSMSMSMMPWRVPEGTRLLDFHYPTRYYSTTRLLSSLSYPTLPNVEKTTTRQGLMSMSMSMSIHLEMRVFPANMFSSLALEMRKLSAPTLTKFVKPCHNIVLYFLGQIWLSRNILLHPTLPIMKIELTIQAVYLHSFSLIALWGALQSTHTSSHPNGEHPSYPIRLIAPRYYIHSLSSSSSILKLS